MMSYKYKIEENIGMSNPNTFGLIDKLFDTIEDVFKGVDRDDLESCFLNSLQAKNMKEFFNILGQEFSSRSLTLPLISNLRNIQIKDLLEKLEQELSSYSLLLPLDVLLVGATGVGKSSTINALFADRVAKVGTGCDPETQVVSSYRVKDYFRIHDSAGLGDGIANDERHAKNIINELVKTISVNGDSSTPYGFIDMVMVILDGSGRDLGTTYQLLKNVILPVIDPKRVIVVINQADMAMKGRYWNPALNTPEKQLIDFLEEKVISTQARIQEATGLAIHKPIYYSAEYRYNIDQIISHIINNLPKERRVIKIDEKTKNFVF